MYAKSIRALLEAFSHLPGVGPRTAERYVFSLLKKGKKDVLNLARALDEIRESVKSCELCWTFSDTNPCHICADPKRSNGILCVVAEPSDAEAIERTKKFSGVYHVLRGTLNASDMERANLKIRELLDRICANPPKEIILALNPDMAGETTMMHLTKKIRETNPLISVTHLARGLPMGSDLRYADDVTLSSALANRVVS